jgi:uncharacterized Fe-S cluster-containing radical SAM superfamily protein
MNIFEQASKTRIRFKTTVGVLVTEDLWCLDLETLDTIAKSLNKSLKEEGEESFIKTKSIVSEIYQLKFDIVKHIIDVKLAEAEASKVASIKKLRREEILKLLEEKQVDALRNKSTEELLKELEDLGD